MDVEEAWGNVLLEKSRHEIHMAWRTLLLSCAFALFVACFTVALGWRICITIGRPLRATLRFAEKITQGDFDTTLNVAQKDEIGGLADVLRAMVAKLKEQIQSAQSQHALAEERGQVAEQCRISAETAEKAAKSRADTLVLAVEKLHGVVETVTFALNDLAEQVRISSEGANAQAHRLDETTTAMYHDHLVHLYHLAGLDWVDVVSAAKADPKATSELSQKLTPWPNSSTGYFKSIKDRLTRIIESGQLGIFTNGYWGHPAYKLPPEANLLVVAHYLEALDFQKDMTLAAPLSAPVRERFDAAQQAALDLLARWGVTPTPRTQTRHLSATVLDSLTCPQP